MSVATSNTPAPTGGEAAPSQKSHAAALSVAANAGLIVIKLIAGAVTGSVSILTEAAHSAADLVASLVAYVSVRKADEPADAQHLYGHAKMEDLAAAFEGMVILIGAGIITYEAITRLIEGSHVHTLGFGIAVIAVSALVTGVVSMVVAARARATVSIALASDAAHLRADMISSLAVLGGLVLVTVTGERWIDAAVALAVAAMIVLAGVRILSRSSRALIDEALPPAEIEAIRTTVVAFGPRHGVVGFHQLRARGSGARRHVDLHVQFVEGTTLEDAHRTAHDLQEEIRGRLAGADVLIHIEPADRVRPGEEIPPPSSE